MSTINEILVAAEDNINTIMTVKDNRYLRNLLECAFIKEKKMNLPPGIPPYKVNAQHEAQTPPGIFWQIAKKIDLLQSKNIKPMRQEMIFIQALETLADTDADTLIHIKDQTLSEKFKGLTYTKLKNVGYFPKDVK